MSSLTLRVIVARLGSLLSMLRTIYVPMRQRRSYQHFFLLLRVRRSSLDITSQDGISRSWRIEGLLQRALYGIHY